MAVAASETEDLPPACINFHGGGFLVGHYEMDCALCRYGGPCHTRRETPQV